MVTSGGKIRGKLAFVRWSQCPMHGQRVYSSHQLVWDHSSSFMNAGPYQGYYLNGEGRVHGPKSLSLVFH